jgi:hypothetical protein
MRIVLYVLLSALCVGCINPPTGTVYLPDDKPGLAWDRNNDGQPDQVPSLRPKLDPATSQPVVDAATGQPVMELVLDDNGMPVLVTDIVPGSSIYKTSETVDNVAPTVLTGIGALVPGGIGAILLGLGAAWRMSRFGRIISNTVMSVQFARQRLKDSGYAEALKLLDEAIESGQVRATMDEITKIKAKMGLPSVTS